MKKTYNIGWWEFFKVNGWLWKETTIRANSYKKALSKFRESRSNRFVKKIETAKILNLVIYLD